MIKAFFQAIFVLAALGIAAGLGFFGGVHMAPLVKQGLVDLSDMPPEMIENHRSEAYRNSEIKQAEMAASMMADIEAKNEALGVKALPEDVPDFPFGPLQNVPAGAVWPEFLPLGDETGALARSKDGWVILNLWASWCAPCVKELPDMDVASGLLAERGVTLLALNADVMGKDTLADVEALYIQRGVQALPPLTADGPDIDAALAAFGMSRMGSQFPTNIIYAPGGQPYALFRGLPEDAETIWASDEMLAFFDALVKSGG